MCCFSALVLLSLVEGLRLPLGNSSLLGRVWFECSPTAQEEMSHRYRISRIKNVLVASVWDRMASVQDFSFVLAFVINILILVAYGTDTGTDTLGEDPRWVCGSRFGGVGVFSFVSACFGVCVRV